MPNNGNDLDSMKIVFQPADAFANQPDKRTECIALLMSWILDLPYQNPWVCAIILNGFHKSDKDARDHITVELFREGESYGTKRHIYKD